MRGSMRLLNKLFILLVSAFIFTTAEARTFKNAYISFEINESWKCTLEQTEWVCRSEDKQESKEAVIILTAKEKGVTDTFPIYTEHLSKPIPLNLKNGTSIVSTITMPPRTETINDQPWIDSLHTNSEVQNYYTRYLATIKDQIAILVTFSVHNKYYAKYQPQFMETVKSLRVIATKDLLSRPDLGPIGGANEILGQNVQNAMPSDLLAAEDDALSSKGKGLLDNNMVLGALFLLLVVAGYIGFKIYQKKKSS